MASVICECRLFGNVLHGFIQIEQWQEWIDLCYTRVRWIIVCLFHKNGDDCDLNHYRQQSIRNVDYKILAKILMNGVNDVCIIIDKNRLVVFRREITLREIVYTGNDTGFFI